MAQPKISADTSHDLFPGPKLFHDQDNQCNRDRQGIGERKHEHPSLRTRVRLVDISRESAKGSIGAGHLFVGAVSL